MKKAAILVVDDSRTSLELIQLSLRDDYRITTQTEPPVALEVVRREQFDLIILDVVMPQMDGYQLCQSIRSLPSYRTTPILFLSSRDSDHEKVLGFQVGGDDYVTKPFNPLELKARVDAKLRRLHLPEPLEFGDYKVDCESHRVFSNSHEIHLTKLEFRILEYLVKNPDQLKTRSQILESVWSLNTNVSERTVDTHMSHLRKKLGSSASLIEAVHSEGYRYNKIPLRKAA